MELFDSLMRGRMQTDINQTRSDTRRTEETAIELEARVRSLERTTRALWSLLKAKTGLTDEELLEHAQAVEAAQGPATCPSCGRRLLVQHAVKCLWCGQALNESQPVVQPESEA